MRAKLLINEVRPNRFEKDGKTYESLDLICFDKSEGERCAHALVVSVDRSQRETLQGRSIRDQVAEVEITSIKVNHRGEAVLSGRITNVEALTGGKLPVEKPAKAAA